MNYRVQNDTGQSSTTNTFPTNSGKSSSTPNTTSVKRISVSLSADAAQLLEYLAQTQGITQNEALRKAIATEAYLLKEMKEGSKILLQKPDKEIREVVFR